MDERGANHSIKLFYAICEPDWFSQILALVIGQRSRIIEETDRKSDEGSPEPGEDEAAVALRLNDPSAEASAKFTDHCEQFYTCSSLVYLLNHRSVIPYVSEEQADAATKNANLKLMFRLSKFYILDEGKGRVIGLS